MKARIGGRMVRVTPHALERYQERVKPALAGRELEKDLRRLLAVCEMRLTPPAWVIGEHAGREWAVCGEDVVFVVVDGGLLTCLTRAYPGDEERARRSKRRAEESQERGRRGRDRRFVGARQSKNGGVARDARRQRRAAREAE